MDDNLAIDLSVGAEIEVDTSESVVKGRKKSKIKRESVIRFADSDNASDGFEELGPSRRSKSHKTTRRKVPDLYIIPGTSSASTSASVESEYFSVNKDYIFIYIIKDPSAS